MMSTPYKKKSTTITRCHHHRILREYYHADDDDYLDDDHYIFDGVAGRLWLPRQSQLLFVLFLFFLLIEDGSGSCSSIGTSRAAELHEHDQAPWQGCDAFMAPTNTTTGWGVFAARDFEYQELLDITPLYIPFEKKTGDTFSLHSRLIQNSALDGYVYKVYRNHLARNQSMVMFGYDMLYNHHPTDPNVIICLGPGYTQGFCARRKISAGEQLLSRYGELDGGKNWFEVRGLTMRTDKFNIDSVGKLEFLKTQYCTKIYAGPGPTNFQQLVPPSNTNESRIAPFDAGLFDARAKVPIKKGDRIEQGPAMLLYKPFVDDTALGPIVISWDDLLPQHQDALRSASMSWGEKLPIHYRGEASQWERIRRMASIEKVAILPFAGRIGLVRRVYNGKKEQEGNNKQESSSRTTTTNVEEDTTRSNCHLEVDVQVQVIKGEDVPPDVTVVLTLVASDDIKVGEVLKMNIKPAGTAYEKELLRLKLSETGHLHELSS